jgi:hypothetical protein
MLISFGTRVLAIPIVQREHITHAQLSAPALAWFYHDPRIIYITLALSPTFLIGGFRVQHLALLMESLSGSSLHLHFSAAAKGGDTLTRDCTGV